jgi:hypothetical protein
VAGDAGGDSDGDGWLDDDELACGTDPDDIADFPADVDGDSVCDGLDACQGDDLSGDSDADGVCDDLDTCPGDVDLDQDGRCDAVDLEPRAVTTAVVGPVVSADEQTLFALRSDLTALLAFDISTPELALAPAQLDELPVEAGGEIELATTLADGRIAITTRLAGQLDVDHLRVYSFDGSVLTLEADISTTSNRLYDVVYDTATDRLYWSNFDLTDSVHYYELGTTPLGHSGLGTSLGSLPEEGSFALLVDGSALYRFRAQITALDTATGTQLHSWPTEGGDVSIGHGNVAKLDDALVYVNRWVTPIRLTVMDVATVTAPQLVASVELGEGDYALSTFDLRRDPDVAVAALQDVGVRVIDLSPLPEGPLTSELLGPAELGGETARGGLDCTRTCCYADSASGNLIVLCP